MNYILAYYQQIQDGSVIVGAWIKLVYEYIINGIQSGAFLFDQKKANRAIKFIETFVHHSEGRNDLLKLELWQKAIVSVMFGIVDENGLRQFREVVIIMGRKNGKTLFASAIIAYMSFLDGEWGSKVFCLAPKLDQADLVFNAFRATVNREPELSSLVKSRKTDLWIQSTESSIKKIAFSEKKSDGYNPHLTICDEIASWPAASGLKQYEVMKSALGARKQPVLLSISTAGYISEGIYDELILRSTRFLKGDSREQRLLPFIYMIDDINKWNDINELRKSNPNLGVSVSVDYLLEEIAIAEQSFSKRAEFLCKYCNIKQNASQAWLSTTTVQKARGEHLEIEDFAESYCLLGIDLSQTTDLTSAVCVVQKNDEFYLFAHFWLPSERIENAIQKDGLPYRKYIEQGILSLSGENFIDYHDCFDWCRSLVEEHHLYPLMVGYDRYSAQYLVQDMKAYGFQTDDVYQGDNLWPIIQEFEGLMKDGKIHIGDNDLLAIHFLNSAIKMSVERGRGKLIKISPTDHIDGMAATLDAFTVRSKWFAQYGDQLKNT